MIELLRRAATADPHRPAIVTESVELSYAEVTDRADDLAAVLRTLRPPKPNGADDRLRFAITSADADVVVPALAAASTLGAEACVLPPDGPDAVARLLSRFGQSHLVHAEATAGEAPINTAGRRWAGVSPSPVAPATAEVLTPRPHLVLTTGTTGEPRGVRHDWARLLRATERVEFLSGTSAGGSSATGAARGERWLLAYGLHQFAGLQVLLHVFAAGATLIAPKPRRPREGLAAMRRHQVTHASATPTYWRFLLAELRSDGGPVPGLRQITLGGEAAPGPVLDQLRRHFPGAQLSHIYAASEFGATNSTKDGQPGLPADVLERGEEADVRMKVVDGELWVRSRVGMVGYHGEPPVEADDWRPTGDLVERVGDRLLFRGRASEVINVGGVKVHPLTIEEAVAAVAGVQVARVFGRPNPMTGAIVAVEIVPEPGADEAQLKAAVRAACAHLPAAARPRSITVVAEIRTTGGKIVRSTA